MSSVAASCIKHAYGLNRETIKNAPSLSTTTTTTTDAKANDASRAAAEELKNLGNSHLAAKRAAEAAEEYTKAIELDPENAVYYSNRAAAFTMQEDYTSAIEDGLAAVSLNPRYAKAYGRLGAAYLGVGNIDKATESYQKALELEPDNLSYKAALEQTRTKVPRTSPRPTPAGGIDFASLMNNPEIMNMAAQMMNNPEAMRNMMNNPNVASMLNGMMGGRGTPERGNGPSPTVATEEDDDS